MKRYARTSFALALLFTPGALIGGCTNPPGALELKLTPAKEVFGRDEPIRFTATFSAKEGAICIDRPVADSFELELTTPNSGEILREYKLVLCGTPAALLWPLYPVILVGHILDVGDCARRYSVITPDSPFVVSFEISVSEGRCIWVWEPTRNFEPEEKIETTPGSYQLKARFKSDSSTGWPPPLFWSAYEEPVEATAEFVIE